MRERSRPQRAIVSRRGPEESLVNSIWLEDFLVLSEARGFSRAAELRFVTQPSFSRRIQALEEWVGTTLVDRSTHTLKLTPSGEAFLPLAQDLLRQISHARQHALELSEVAEQKLRFAATHVLSLTFFPTWLKKLEENEPITATVELTADHMVACENLMLEGSVQFLICHHHVDAPVGLQNSFRSLIIGKDTLVPVATPALLEKHQVESLPRLAFSESSGMGRVLANVLRMRGSAAPPIPTFTSHLSSVLTAMARNGRGVAWSPMSQVADDLAAGRLARVPDIGDPIEIQIRIWRQTARQSAAAEALWARAKAISEYVPFRQ
jgi:DNA-binding transcriptional LysR family regulator